MAWLRRRHRYGYRAQARPTVLSLPEINTVQRCAQRKAKDPGAEHVISLVCGGNLHKISIWERGRITLHNHKKGMEEAEAIARVLKDKNNCECRDIRSEWAKWNHYYTGSSGQEIAKRDKFRDLRIWQVGHHDTRDRERTENDYLRTTFYERLQGVLSWNDDRLTRKVHAKFGGKGHLYGDPLMKPGVTPGQGFETWYNKCKVHMEIARNVGKQPQTLKGASVWEVMTANLKIKGVKR